MAIVALSPILSRERWQRAVGGPVMPCASAVSCPAICVSTACDTGRESILLFSTIFRADPMYDLIIRNGTLIDGTNTPRRQADVALKSGRIAEIGAISARGREELDARGLIVAPGFIDAHTHDDLAVLVEPEMTPKISQGVTTCVCGNCGLSAAPLPDGRLPEPLNLVSLTKISRFHKTADYLQALRETPCAVNTVPLLGHSALRASVMDDVFRPATASEIKAMRALAEQALREGFHGVSTGTFYASAAQADTNEIISVCEPLGRLGGVFATHMREEADKVVDSIHETAAIGRALGVRTIISHHKVAGMNNHGRSAETLGVIDGLRKGQAMGLDCYPYSASSTVLRADRVRIAEKTLLTHSKPYPQYAGREVGELVRELGQSVEAVCDLLQPAGAVYFMMNESDVERILQYPDTMIGSDGIPLQEKPHPRLWGTFPRVLGHYSRNRKLFPLETAVYKMTGLVAREFNLVGRGVIAPGNAADITLFNADTVIDQATFENPSLPSLGIDCVIVNGVIAWQHGEHRARPGQLLARSY